VKQSMWLGCGVLLSLAAVFLVSWRKSMTWLKIKHEEVYTSKLPRGARPIRILHISDLHGRDDMEMNLDIWREVDRLDFDLAVITGDIVLRDHANLKPHLAGLRALAARVPTFFVDGNHEKGIYGEVAQRLSDVGIRVLANEKVKVRAGDSEIDMIGYRDYYFLQKEGFFGVDKLTAQDSGRYTVILEHQPQLFPLLKGRPFDLMLSGHTHGGQVRLPLLPVLYAPGQGILPRYGQGWYSQEKGGFVNNLYISQGIGATKFPVRLFNRPEIAIISIIGDGEP